MVKALTQRHEKYNEDLSYIEKREKEGAAFILRPQQPLSIGRIEHNPDRMRQVYEYGRDVALQSLEKIKTFCSSVLIWLLKEKQCVLIGRIS